MSSFQAQLHQLKKNTRSRVSEVSARISTEIADEAMLMQHRASVLSSRASRVASRARKGISYHGEIPPPPPVPPTNEYESANPMYNSSGPSMTSSSSASSSDSHANLPIPKSDIKPVQLDKAPAAKKSTSASNGNSFADHSLADNINWLAKKMSIRFSFRELKDQPQKPEMVSVPLPPITERSDPNAQSATLAEKAKQNPLLNKLLSAPAPPPKIVLNKQFEEYRMREFLAALRGQFASVKPGPAGAGNRQAMVPPTTTGPQPEKILQGARSVKELRQAFSANKVNTAAASSSSSSNKPLTSPINSNKPPLGSGNSFNNKSKANTPATTTSTTTTPKATPTTPVSPLNATSKPSAFFGGSTSSSTQATTTSSSARTLTPAPVPKVTLNERFDQYRMREFFSVPQRLRKAAQETSAKKAAADFTLPILLPTLATLNVQFEKYRHREFIHVLQENIKIALRRDMQANEDEALAEIKRMNDEPKPLSKTASASSLDSIGSSQSGRQPARPTFIIPPNGGSSSTPPSNVAPNSGSLGRSSSRVIKRTSGLTTTLMRFEDMPILDEDVEVHGGLMRAQPATRQERARTDSLPKVEANGFQIPPPPHDSSLGPQATVMKSMDDGHQPTMNKRGSFVSRAFKVLSGSFGGAASHAPAAPPAPPQFPFSDFDLLQMDMQRAERELQFHDYARLSTVYETRNEYVDSFSSDAAVAYDSQRRAMNMATL